MNKMIPIAFLAGVLSSVVGGTFGLIMATPYTQERTELVFVYDNLTNPITRMYACYCRSDLQPATLSGYVKGVRTIVGAPSGEVSGGLIALSEEEFARLDRFKEFPRKYRRDRVTVNGHLAWIYVKQ